MSAKDVSSSCKLPDELLETIFMDFLYRDELVGDQLEYDNFSTSSSAFTSRFNDFALAVVPANRRFHGIASRVLWRCVIIRSLKDLTLVHEQVLPLSNSPAPLNQVDPPLYQTTRDSVPSSSLPTLTRRLDMDISGRYPEAVVQQILLRMTGLRILVVRNFHVGRDAPFMPTAAHLFLPLQELTHGSVERVQMESRIVRPSARDVVDLLRTKPALKVIRVSRFQANDTSPDASTPRPPAPSVTTPPARLTSLQLTALSLGAIEPYDHPVSNTCMDALLTDVLGKFAFPCLTTLDLFEPCDMAITFLKDHGAGLHRLAFAAPTAAPSEYEYFLESYCPSVEELVWVIRGWGTLAPPKDGHNGISKVAILYVKHPHESTEDCVEQLCDAVDAFSDGAWPALLDLEVVVRGRNLPHSRECGWDDKHVLEVQILRLRDGWRAVFDVDQLTAHLNDSDNE